MHTRSYSLEGTWQLVYGEQLSEYDRAEPPSDWPVIAAEVPGNVEIDLMSAGILPDLTIGNNVYLLREYEYHEWWYLREVILPAIATGESAELVFDGLDCIADVWLDSELIGHANNMLIPQRFDITHIVGNKTGSTVKLSVRIYSAVLEGRKHHSDPLSSAFSTNWESLAVRKAPHMYGWDIMPRVVSAGLWRDVHIDISAPTHLRSVYYAVTKVNSQQHTASVLVDWDFQTELHNVDDLRIRISLANTMNEVLVLNTHGKTKLELANVELWWPRGSGQPKLYNANFELLDASGNVLDAHEVSIGLRTVELHYSDITLPDKPGEFVFVVNGERVFVKGTNWVPLDALHSRDRSHLDAAMAMIADLNCNMIRCWGGNVYEDHPFFDKCDELGVMVWQDFALACAIYPQSDQFADAIRTEAEIIVSRLRNHPSLVLWAGNNEIDEAYAWSGLAIDPNTDRLSRVVLPSVVRRLDPYRPYLPSSPYRSPFYVQTQKQIDMLPEPFNAQPEQHLWGPRTDFKGDFYTKSLAHFASEIGYHGCPNRASLERFLDKVHLWPWHDNEQWLTHATRPHLNMRDFNYRIALMASQIKVLFDEVPDNLDDFVLASQISQAEAKKFFVEWFRQGKWRRTGILWWNLRDGWPVISDAIVDYYGAKKLAYEYIKRSQADVCVICCEPVNGRYPIMVVNDTRDAVSGVVVVKELMSQCQLLKVDCDVAAGSTLIAGFLDVISGNGFLSMEYISIALPMRNHYLYGSRPYRLDQYKLWLSMFELSTH